MTDSAEKMREAIKRFHRNCCYPEAFDFEVDGLMNELAALSAGETKSDGEVKEPSASIPDYNGVKSPALVTAHGLSGKSCPLSRVAPGPSDIIPSQPDERERIQQIIELAMIEEAEIQYADFADRDRQREKIITSAAAAILAMQAERRGFNPAPGWLAEDVKHASKQVEKWEAPAQPAPIAGLEPVAWQLRYSDSNDPWVIAEKVNTTSLIEWRGLVPVEQAQAHAAEQVRAEREVCASIIDARCAEVLSRQYSDDPPPTEFEQSVNTNLRLTAVLLPDLSAAIRARGQV